MARAVLAGLRGWPVRHLDRPPGAPKPAGTDLQELLRPFARVGSVPFAGLTFDGIGNIPATGPAIVCFNHRSYFDATVVGMAVHRAGRSARFLGKKELFDLPLLGGLAAALGGIPVERGSGSDAPLDAAAAALGDGELVVIAPQGTIPRGPDFFDPVLRGRWGAARLAVATGAPVVPLGLWGTEKVWPRSARLPDLLNVVDPPAVSVAVGRPVALAGADPDADTVAIMAAIVELLPDAARVRREPTQAELARTYPRST